jgi:hypothetical protein
MQRLGEFLLQCKRTYSKLFVYKSIYNCLSLYTKSSLARLCQNILIQCKVGNATATRYALFFKFENYQKLEAASFAY